MLCNAYGTFLRLCRPDSAKLLEYYFATTKILNSMRYAEAVARSLKSVPGHSFTSDSDTASTQLGFTWVIQDKIEQSLDALTKEDLAPFISFLFARIIEAALMDKMSGVIDSLFASSESLAESFVISDPSKTDIPITYSSDGKFENFPLWHFRWSSEPQVSI